MKKQFLALLTMMTLVFASGCGNITSSFNNSNTGSDSSSEVTSATSTTSTTSEVPVEKFDVIFKDGDTVVKEYLDQVPGTLVDIPKLEDKGRTKLTGWTGISDADFASGKVQVYEDDATYNAIWYERFGTDKVFDATAKRSTHTINVDGVKDEAYDDTTAIEIKSDDVSASAKAYVMYDYTTLYVLVEVTDASKYQHIAEGQEVNSCDSVALYVDLLHNESLAIDNYSTGWGNVYRGEPGPMVEGWYKISRGYDASVSGRYSDKDGSMFCFAGWLSEAAKTDGSSTFGTTKETDAGYNVEYKIELTNGNIPEDYKPKVGNQFGLGIVLFDQDKEGYTQTEPASKKVGIEECNLEAEVGPKRLSNFVYKVNDEDGYTEASAVKVRDCFEVSTENTRDALYKDAKAISDGDNTLEILHGNNKYYIYAKPGANSSSVKLTFEGLDTPYEITSAKKIIVDDTNKKFSLSYTANGEEVSHKYYISDVSNANNLSSPRKMFTTKFTSETITVDGELDDAYDKSVKFDVSDVTYVEHGEVLARGSAYSMFNDDNLYVFVDVTDENVDSTSNPGDNSPEINDSVELWISTCQSLPTSTTSWGFPNRPSDWYCGEGLFRVRAGMEPVRGKGLTGTHWLFDKAYTAHTLDVEIATKLTDTGYTVEYKIPWDDFKSKVANDQVIDILIAINDGENNTASNNNRRGVVTTNANNGLAWWDRPYVLDHLKLAGK